MTNVKEMTDLELGKVQGQMYNELMRVQNNLQAINEELNLRLNSVPKPEESTDK